MRVSSAMHYITDIQEVAEVRQCHALYITDIQESRNTIPRGNRYSRFEVIENALIERRVPFAFIKRVNNPCLLGNSGIDPSDSTLSAKGCLRLLVHSLFSPSDRPTKRVWPIDNLIHDLIFL